MAYTNLPLVEAREFMSATEKKLKAKLVALLRDDGKGHRHAKYAERLEKFDIQIVPLRADPRFTAAIAFDRAIIYISEGFLNDPATFYQLNVLLRHELAHNLLMHQIRMAYKLGEATHVHMSMSDSLHSLHNIIADDEISNRKYSDEDKIIVRNMVLNGRVIGGLVTEDHRESWINMSIEEMYDQICEEIEQIQAKLLSGRSLRDVAAEKPDDFITKNLLRTYIYSDTKGDSMFSGSLADFIAGGCRVNGERLKKEFAEVVTSIYERLKDEDMDDDEVQRLLAEVAQSSPIKPLDLFRDKTVVLYTPEEKYIAVEVLKKYKSEYAEWYDKVMSSLDDLTPDELQALLDAIK